MAGVRPSWRRPCVDQLARDALDDFGVLDIDDRVGIGEAQHQEEVMPT